MFTSILALTGMLSGLGALALGWHALSSARVVGSESRALAQRAAAVSASGVDPFAVRDVAVLHYDALEEMSGARSFSLALLNSEGDGVVVTSINGRTESRTYAKAVVGGECDTLLSPEEYRVVRSARLGEGVGAAANAGSPSSREVPSAGVRPTPPSAVREEPGPPSSRDGERCAGEDAEAVDAGPTRERDEAAPAASTGTGAGTGPAASAARTAPTAPTSSAVPNGAGVTRGKAEPAPAGPSARTARATEPVADDDREASEVVPASTGTGASAVRSASAAPGGDREEQEPRGLVSVIRRTVGRGGADRRPPVAAVRSGVGAARPIASANVTVRPGPSATAAGSTGTPATGNTAAAQQSPEAPADEEAGGEGAREAEAPAPEARR
ncbi:DUF4446 family protein [Nocardiopsis sp. RV163]|uniref:DUF4446 family protein n=1 Tax=Nocardiopsis sp. RV163 TaxID=1661388 RepID=UPI00373FCD22